MSAMKAFSMKFHANFEYTDFHRKQSNHLFNLGFFGILFAEFSAIQQSFNLIFVLNIFLHLMAVIFHLKSSIILQDLIDILY